jgi:hypothetical protein
MNIKVKCRGLNTAQNGRDTKSCQLLFLYWSPHVHLTPFSVIVARVNATLLVQVNLTVTN